MPIRAPGIRSRNGTSKKSAKRNVVGVLSLTAMVDMFTVLTVFLLQNYNVTGQVLNLPKDIVLPEAAQVKDLKPAHIVTLTATDVLLDDVKVASFANIKEQKDWLINPLYKAYEEVKKADDLKKNQSIRNTLQQAVRTATNPNAASPEDDSRVTLQADKGVDFLSVKKVMYTLTQAGAVELNFAVIKLEK